MTLHDQLQALAQAQPAAPAVIFHDRTWSRGALMGLVARVIRLLQERGIAAGMHVGVSMDQSPLHLAVLIGLARLGAISLPVHPRWPLSQRQDHVERFGLACLVHLPGYEPPAGVTGIALSETLSEAQTEHSLDFIDYRPQPADPARLCLTSGTTGRPNAVLYSHTYWLYRIGISMEHCDPTTRVLPTNLHVTLGNLPVFAALLAGGVVVFPRDDTLPAFHAALREHAVTHSLIQPRLIPLLADLHPTGDIAYPDLRVLRIMGSSLNARLVRLAKTRLTPNIYLPYGMSELGTVALGTPELLEAHPDSVGRATPGTQAEVVGPDGEVLPVGTSGELRVKAPMMPPGFYCDEARTAERFRDGWFMTRDCAVMSEDGLIRIEGRMDDKIVIGGLKFFPQRVEEALRQHPEVADAAVFIQQLPGNERILAAAVVLNHAGPLQRRLIDFCMERRMGPFTPRRFVLVGELPYNAAGKLLRSELQALVAAASSR